MKSGISLVDMAKEIQRQLIEADYMLDTRSLRLEPFDSKLYLNAYDQSVSRRLNRWRLIPLPTGRSAHT